MRQGNKGGNGAYNVDISSQDHDRGKTKHDLVNYDCVTSNFFCFVNLLLLRLLCFALSLLLLCIVVVLLLDCNQVKISYSYSLS